MMMYGRKMVTAISDLGLLALGLQRVPVRPEGAVVGVEHGGEGHLDLAQEVVGEVLVLVGDAYEELLLEVPDPEGELLVPDGVGRLPDHLGLGPLSPQLQLGVRVAQPLRLRRREVAGLDDMHHKPHFLFSLLLSRLTWGFGRSAWFKSNQEASTSSLTFFFQFRLKSPLFLEGIQNESMTAVGIESNQREVPEEVVRLLGRGNAGES